MADATDHSPGIARRPWFAGGIGLEVYLGVAAAIGLFVAAAALLPLRGLWQAIDTLARSFQLIAIIIG